MASSHGEDTHQDLSEGTAREYLDTLSEVRKSTWEVYKGQVEKAKEIKHDEIDCKNVYACVCLYFSLLHKGTHRTNSIFFVLQI